MRILVITSCTGEKAFKSDQALTLDDFARGGKHLKQREKELKDLMLPAEELYTGQQHVRLMRGVQAFREHGSSNGSPLKLDLWVLSAGYGLVPGDRKLAPYECTFQGMKTKELRQWADTLKVPDQFRELVRENYDLALILLGDSYLAACAIDATVPFSGPTLLFCGTGAAKRLPKLPQVKVTTISNPDAKRFSCPLVSIKGEIATRLLSRLVAKDTSPHNLADPAFDVLSSIVETQAASSNGRSTRKKAVANPNVDRVIQIPRSWWDSKHRTKLRYYIPEWDDLVDPDYDFLKDEHSGQSSDWSNEVYAHQLLNAPAYDGILVSRVVAEKSKNKKARINAFGVHRYVRVPQDFPIMGDCGAFGYITEKEPPYTTSEVLDYYTRLGFNSGVSVDHLIVSATESEKQFRYELTISNAREFIKEHGKRGLSWTPIGAVQGWDPISYAKAAKQYVSMGYKYIGLGGLVRSSTSDILRIVEEVNRAIPADVAVHLFGLARIRALKQFADLGVRSVDSASYLRQAWMRDSQGYLTPKGSYAALRIPEIGKSFRAKRMLEESGLTESKARKLEQQALSSLRSYDAGKCSLDNCLEDLLAYDAAFGRDTNAHRISYRRTLQDTPWKTCLCPVCRESGVEVIIFRGNNRNRRRGFHNTFVFYEELKRVLAGKGTMLGAKAGDNEQPTLFPMGDDEEGTE